MLRRFAAATAVAAPTVGIATSIVLVSSPVPLERFAPLLALWCVAAAFWGVWAMVAPQAWVPQRLPAWGAIVGVLAAMLAMFVLDVPARIAGTPVAASYRAFGAVALTGLYYLLWTLVRHVYRALGG